MKHIIIEKIREGTRSVIPLTLFVTALNYVILLISGKSMPDGMLVQFIVGAVFVLAGIFFLALGEDLAMIKMGDRIGSHLAKTGKYWLLIVCCFLIGALLTLAEPNLKVFSSLLPGIPDMTVIITASIGVGVFLVLGVLRVIKKVPIPVTLTSVFLLIFLIAALAPHSAVAVAFDSGGVATGPITASFIMAVGVGLASVRGGKSSVDDSFGAVAFCTLGPIAALLLLGVFGRTGSPVIESVGIAEHADVGVILDFIKELPEFIEEVAIALLPIIVLFVLFQFIFFRMRARSLIGIGVGVFYAFLGHTLFLTGVFVGFLPAGAYLGRMIVGLPNGLHLLLIPVGMIMGAFIVNAEPAVHVLVEQVEEVTVGAVTRRAMLTMITVGAAAAVGLSMLRLLSGVSIWYFLIGGYAVSLLLSFFVPKVFTAIAFDSGGASTGAMTVAFLLPFAKGACEEFTGSGEHVLTDAFGLVALVVMFPIITIQLLGLVYKLKLGRSSYLKRCADSEVTVIEFDTGGEADGRN